MDAKEQIAMDVRQIDDLNRQIAEHWSMVQKCLSQDDVDGAISLLNAYFRLKTKLVQVESALQGQLRGYFSDK
jgi:hypothetical protein